MKDLIKILLIYMILIAIIVLILDIGFIDKKDNIKILFIETLSILCLFKFFKVNSIAIIIFMSIISVFMVLIAINSDAYLKYLVQYGIGAKLIFISEEQFLILQLILVPFLSLFDVLISFNILNLSIYIVPLYMFILTTISVKFKNIKLLKI